MATNVALVRQDGCRGREKATQHCVAFCLPGRALIFQRHFVKFRSGDMANVFTLDQINHVFTHVFGVIANTFNRLGNKQDIEG